MKEFAIYYKGTEGTMVGSGRGKSEAEAVADFRFWHGDVEIVKVELYK